MLIVIKNAKFKGSEAIGSNCVFLFMHAIILLSLPQSDERERYTYIYIYRSKVLGSS